MMNKGLKVGFISVVAVIILLAGSAENAKAQGVLREILNRMDAHNKSLSSLRADVRMEKLNSQLGETDVTTGNTSYLPKTAKRVMYVRIDWTKPVEEQIVIIGDTYKLYRPRLKQLYVGKTSEVQSGNKVPGNALAFMSMSKQQLNANYQVNYIGEETTGGTKTWHLELLPKTNTSYKSAELWVDGNGMPLQAKIIEKNSDATTVLLSNIQKNVTIQPTDFILNVPKGIKPIQG
jgi:outer membrane lipoprotein-sorting protein